MPVLLRALLLALVLAGAVVRPATAAPAPPTIGIADQKLEMFASPLLGELGVKQARYVVGWDVMRGGFQLDELRSWLTAAQLQGIRPLLTFGHSRREGRQKLRPSPTEVQREFRKLRAAFPHVREFAAWNEPNHCGQPLCNRPELAARYFDAMVGVCPSCTIVAGELLDQPNMVSWVKRFQKRSRHVEKVWGLHNYVDVNRFRTSGTKALLKATKAQIWLTETGGIVTRRTKVRIRLPAEGPAHAARATRWLFDRLVPLSSRIRRVYVYHWNSSTATDSWDSALIDHRGRRREAWYVVKARIERARAATARGRAAARAR